MSSPIASSSIDVTRLYVPVHRRSPGSWSSRTSSPSSSSSSSPSLSPSCLPSPTPTHHTLPTIPGVYTPAELVLLSGSPLAKLPVEALRAIAPEVVWTRRQRKAYLWHARQSNERQRGTGAPAPSRTHKRPGSQSSQSHTSESEEDKSISWRTI